MSEAPHVVINGQKIPWSFIQWVRRAFGGCWDRTMDCFYNARHATGNNGIIRYIRAGFKPNDKGVRYALLPSKEHENGNMEAVRRWWTSEVHKSKRPPMSLGAVLRKLMVEE